MNGPPQRVRRERLDGGCDREPIHVPGSIQPFGTLLVIDPADGRVVQAACPPGASVLAPGDPLGRPLGEVLADGAGRTLDRLVERVPASGTGLLGLVRPGGIPHHVIGHRSDGMTVIELEPAGTDPSGADSSGADSSGASGHGAFDEVHPHVRDFLDAVQTATSIDRLCALAAREVRRITGLDRVLIYRFDPAWNGEVIAEDRNDRLPSYLGLRFPAADIPAQARALYRLNRLRLIPDADYEAVPIRPAANPRTGRPLDLGLSVLRSVSPIHREYMRNMGTMASMSISLLREGALWGLISCHNRTPARVPYQVRIACDVIGQVLSLQLAATETAAAAEHRNALRGVHGRLLAAMASAEHFVGGLAARPDDLLALTGASGAAVVTGGRVVRIGAAPAETDILKLVDRLAEGGRDDVFVTDRLADAMPGGEAIKDTASGVLAISISQLHDSYLLWFRPETIHTVSWGGDPRKVPSPDHPTRLGPRTSFEAWRETVRLTSPPWRSVELEAAAELRTAIVDIVLRKAEETAALSERLTSINKELEAFSYSVSHDLRAPFRHIVGYAELLKKFEGERLSERGLRYVDTIVESAVSAGKLVDDLLGFSQMGRAALAPVPVDMNALVAEVRRRLAPDLGERAIAWRIAALPPTRADPMMLRLAMQNLVENAVKFTRGREPAVIEIFADQGPEETVYRVRDNGAGFDMAYVEKLFGVFQRLHRVEEFEGTGIGLANVKRIVERHGGRVWAEGSPDGGATFSFVLPGGHDTSGDRRWRS